MNFLRSVFLGDEKLPHRYDQTCTSLPAEIYSIIAAYAYPLEDIEKIIVFSEAKLVNSFHCIDHSFYRILDLAFSQKHRTWVYRCAKLYWRTAEVSKSLGETLFLPFDPYLCVVKSIAKKSGALVHIPLDSLKSKFTLYKEGQKYTMILYF